MMNLQNLSLAPLGAVFIALGTANIASAAVFYGQSQSLGNGAIRSFVTLDDTSGKPLDIGISFLKAALDLPPGSGNPYNTNEYITTELSLPSQAASTPFNNFEVNYRPNGFPPGGPVTQPLFDLYFFQISPEERDLICPNPDTSSPIPNCVGEERAVARKTPVAGTLPVGVIPLIEDTPERPGSPLRAVPRYGTRYYDGDLAISVFNNPQSLTSFYGYGFSDGKPNFTNIILAEAFLEKEPNDSTTQFKLPTKYLKSGYYPTAYNVKYDPTLQEYRLSLTGLTYRSIPESSYTVGLLGLGALGAASRLRRKRSDHKGIRGSFNVLPAIAKTSKKAKAKI
ncbi:MAG: hypothetical protein RMY16_02230 [Nostoc sp. DedQUE12b]|uniref:hypothetical protein n=1 Tax=Nostoc sp. DedQUE12b TaxID=3075398 RepID=UPI002AD40679|nr:hypothetical protein [Nostoc sp. DedQUE12b]MDZ8084401.1 hypothetical protein [Nostoc sp. DedQUE12b]